MRSEAMGAYYYAIEDENCVLCVDKVGEGNLTPADDVLVRRLASQYPDVIYFHHWAGEPSLRETHPTQGIDADPKV